MLTLHVERRNEEARHFYQSLGYTAVGSRDVTLSSLLQGEAHLLQFSKPLTYINSIDRLEKQQRISVSDLTAPTTDCL